MTDIKGDVKGMVIMTIRDVKETEMSRRDVKGTVLRDVKEMSRGRFFRDVRDVKGTVLQRCQRCQGDGSSDNIN